MLYGIIGAMPEEVESLTNIMENNKSYSDEFKLQFLADAKKMPNNKLAKKYGITAKASSARKASWTKYFENKSK